MGDQFLYQSYKPKEKINELWLSSFMIHEYIITREYDLALILAIELYNEGLGMIWEYRDSCDICKKHIELMSDLIDEILLYMEFNESYINN